MWKALAIMQPWAYLIVNGLKDIENRTWQTNFRGKVLIHASKGFDKDCFDKDGNLLNPYYWLDDPPDKLFELINNKSMPLRKKDFETGGIVGVAEIVDCVSRSKSAWFVGEYGFVLKNARTLPFTPLKGNLNFFNVPEEITANLPL